MADTITHYTNTIFFGLFWPSFTHFLMAVPFGCALELLLPNTERQSLASRVRGVAFATASIFLGAILVRMGTKLTAMLGVKPLLTYDLSNTSENFIVFLLGVTVLPFTTMFIYDFFYYWFHRAQHAVPILWRFHSAHHAIEELNAINSYHHPLENFLRVFLISLPMTALIQITVPQSIIVSALTVLAGPVFHADTRMSFGPMRYLICEPRYHRLHHSIEPQHWNRNFAFIFPIFDILFRTARFPVPGETHRTGLIGQREAQSVRSYLWPTPPRR